MLRHLVWFTTSLNFFPKDKQEKVVPIKYTELRETLCLGVSKKSAWFIKLTFEDVLGKSTRLGID